MSRLPLRLLSARALANLGLPLLLLASACNDKGDDPATDDSGFTEDTSVEELCAEDRDGDGYDNCDDCDDLEPATHPDADELCDGEDNDCDEEVDDDNALGSVWYQDADGDGYGDEETTTQACDQPAGFVADATDCDDDAEGTYPGADEICDGLDNDCDGETDEDAVDQETFYTDGDADGYGDDDSVVLGCEAPEGASLFPGDCDDADPAFNPSATEDDCTDPTDYNCDGSVGEGGGEDRALHRGFLGAGGKAWASGSLARIP